MSRKEIILKEKYQTFKGYLSLPEVSSALEAAVPKWLTPDRLLRVVYSTALTNPKLMDCTPASILRAVVNCAYLGLEPVLGRAWLIPYEIKGVLNCQFQIGYLGLVDLARRSGQINAITSQVIYKNDYFVERYGLEEVFEHKPLRGEDRGQVIGAYTRWVYTNGYIHIPGFIDIADIHKRRDASQAYMYGIKNPKRSGAQDSPWFKWPDEMIKKTAIKMDAKMQPSSIEFMEAVTVDNLMDKQPDLNPWANLSLPEPDAGKTTPGAELASWTPEDFNKEFSDITKEKLYKKFWELTVKANAGGGERNDDEIKIAVMSDPEGPEAFRGAFLNYKKSNTPKKTAKKTGGSKAKDKKSSPAGAEKAASGKKAENSTTESEDEFDALVNSDDWQEMSQLKDAEPELYAKYSGGKDPRTFEVCTNIIEGIYADLEERQNAQGPPEG